MSHTTPYPTGELTPQLHSPLEEMITQRERSRRWWICYITPDPSATNWSLPGYASRLGSSDSMWTHSYSGSTVSVMPSQLSSEDPSSSYRASKFPNNKYFWISPVAPYRTQSYFESSAPSTMSFATSQTQSSPIPGKPRLASRKRSISSIDIEPSPSVDSTEAAKPAKKPKTSSCELLDIKKGRKTEHQRSNHPSIERTAQITLPDTNPTVQPTESCHALSDVRKQNPR
ncbi:hypothetical protein P171DRAFT_445662 [Karstenula rhodostoma CBS 690.94]|uniref:Uncharacterized protein n=1 Tax=Karstenula rhodostoma CBS 690.94 TaxID=1392251 RepID=A0A9P4UAE7_9PLEO|nr:hypothetical protein P171DRAFT_445662 [Karstenula rhodostoma CBS 690.94]